MGDVERLSDGMHCLIEDVRQVRCSDLPAEYIYPHGSGLLDQDTCLDFASRDGTYPVAPPGRDVDLQVFIPYLQGQPSFPVEFCNSDNVHRWKQYFFSDLKISCHISYMVVEYLLPSYV